MKKPELRIATTEPTFEEPKQGLVPDITSLIDNTNLFTQALEETSKRIGDVATALESHRSFLLNELNVIDEHTRKMMDLAQAERLSKVEAVQAGIAMVDKMISDLRGG